MGCYVSLWTSRKERSLGLDDDKQKPARKRTQTKASASARDTTAGPSAEGDGLGELAAELSGKRASVQSPADHASDAGESSDDAMDAGALAALSQAHTSRPPRVDQDGAAARVRLSDVPASERLATVGGSVPPPAASVWNAAPVWIALAVGLAFGVPLGGFLFSDTRVVERVVAAPVPSGPVEPAVGERFARPATADERMRNAVAMRAAIRLPARDAQQLGAAEQLRAAAPAATEPTTAAAQPQPGEPGQRAAATATQPAAVAPRPQSAAPAKPAPTAAAAAPAAQPQPAAAAAAAAAPAAARGPDGRSMNDLLDQALTPAQRANEARARQALGPAGESLPLSPGRDDVTRAMTVLLPAIRGCASGQSGLATVAIVVRNDGRVESAAVSGAPFEGERSGRCMEGVVRRAKFPRFQQSSFRVQFPFAIQ